MTAESEYSSTDIAVVGLAGRFPRAPNIEEFWQRLCDGVECISQFSEEELLEAGIPEKQLANPAYVKANAWLEDADMFDADFFGFSPREAEAMDPQHRIFLECAYNALENAGYGNGYDGPVGVFAGASMNSYYTRNLQWSPEVLAAAGSYQVMIGNDKDFVATRVAYKLNLKGPALTIQTACSTSLVAIQVACQSLLTYQSDMALAGGVSLFWPQKQGYLYQEGMINSPDGHCRAFDANAEGTLGGQGVGIVVLKRLDDALRDGDTVHAIVKGAAINNDGSHKVGYTAPSVDGQAEVIAMAQAMAGVEPDSITLIEAHGTGTPLGDPIEIAALTQVFRASTERKQYCALGSVKTNIGHLDAAAGVAGFIKAVLSVERGVIPPSLHYERPNPQIDFANSPFRVQAELGQWETNGVPRRAGVSSFGIGGTNAHAVLEQPPAYRPVQSSRRWQVLPWSARTEAALESATANLGSFLATADDAAFADIAFTLQAGRQRFACRQVLVAASRDEAAQVIAGATGKLPRPVTQEMSERPVVFMFSGQGSQYAGMASGLYADEAVFRGIVDECASILQSLLDLDIRDIIFHSADGTDADRINQTRFTQPALFVVEYALARQWMQWGIHPEAMIGHSIGEYVAACLAGVITLPAALQLVATRGRLMQEQPAGDMLAVMSSAEKLTPFINAEVSLAAVNGPEFCTLSGSDSAIRAVTEALAEQDIDCRPVHTSHAFHSSMMDGILDAFTDAVRAVELQAPVLPYLSNVSGTWITAEQATSPEYWGEHLRGTVRFADGVAELTKDPSRVLLEVGPGKTLATFARQTSGPRGAEVVQSLPHPTEQDDDGRFLVSALARLWQSGVDIDWSGVAGEAQRCRVPVPGYAFERKRFLAEPKPLSQLLGKPTGAGTAQKNPRVADWFYLPSWRRSLPVSMLPAIDADAAQASDWLIFADELGVADTVVAALAEHDIRPLLVRRGGEFAQQDQEITLDGTDLGQCQSLAQLVSGLDQRPCRVLYLWSLTDTAAADEADTSDFYALLFLAQALGERMPAAIQFVIAAPRLHAVNDSDPIEPRQSLILGPAKTIPREYPNMTSRAVDVLAADAAEDTERTAQNLLAEFGLSGTGTAAYRGAYRWVQSYEPVALPALDERPAPIRTQGVYLVTGGLGGIGLALAGYLAETAQARLVLTSRSSLPPRDSWTGYLESADADDSTAVKLRSVLALEAAGAEVLVMAADASDQHAMSAVVAAARERFGEINGVIHAAGIAGDGIMQMKTQAAADAVLASKVQGTLLLESLLGDEARLEFVLLCSSINSIYGGAAVVDYAAANAYLDAFAVARRRDSRAPVTSVNWDAWQSVGMAVNAVETLPAGMQAARRKALRLGILPEEGVEAFQRVLSQPVGQIVVSTRDVRQILSSYDIADKARFEAAATSASAATAADEEAESAGATRRHERPALASEFVAPRNDDEAKLVAIWTGLLGIQEIGVDDDFFELGGHSLLGTRVLARIQEEFSLKLPLQTIFEAPTVAQLAERIQTLRWASQGGDEESDDPPEDVEEVVF